MKMIEISDSGMVVQGVWGTFDYFESRASKVLCNVTYGYQPIKQRQGPLSLV